MCRKKHKKMLKQYLISSRVSEWWWERDYTKNLMKAPHTGSSNLLDAWVYFQTHWQRFFFRKKFLFFSLTVLCGWEFDVFSCERVSERETFFMIYRAFHFYIHMCTHNSKECCWLLLLLLLLFSRKRNWITPATHFLNNYHCRCHIINSTIFAIICFYKKSSTKVKIA